MATLQLIYRGAAVYPNPGGEDMATLQDAVSMNTSSLAGMWWAVALRGLLALLFGIATLFIPGLALTTLALLFGAYALLDGVAAIASGLREHRGRWPLLLLGLLGVGAGIMTFLNPAITALALLALIAWWAVLTGILEIVAAIRFRRTIPGAWEWLIALSGLLSVALGVLMLLFPTAGVLTVETWIAAYALIAGGTLLVLGFQLRGQASRRM